VTHEPGCFDRQAAEICQWSIQNTREHEENIVNTNVRQIIENSFKKQLEQMQNGKQNENKISNEKENSLKKCKNNQV
jgi:predicted Fe-S protein YdhL (DUF1289 family)